MMNLRQLMRDLIINTVAASPIVPHRVRLFYISYMGVK